MATLSVRRTRRGKLLSWVCVGGDRGAIMGSAGYPSELTLRLCPLPPSPLLHPHMGLGGFVLGHEPFPAHGAHWLFICAIHLQA